MSTDTSAPDNQILRSQLSELQTVLEDVIKGRGPPSLHQREMSELTMGDLQSSTEREQGRPNINVVGKTKSTILGLLTVEMPKLARSIPFLLIMFLHILV